MSVTEELRHMLDEQGVEWSDEFAAMHRSKFTHFEPKDQMQVDVWEHDGWFSIQVTAEMDLIPEQVIAATIERGTCYDVGEYPAFRCSECGGWTFVQTGNCSALIDSGGNVFESPKYCPLCGRKVVVK